VATAMVLYEVARRGWMKQITGSAPAPRIVRPQLPAPSAIAAPAGAEAGAEAGSERVDALPAAMEQADAHQDGVASALASQPAEDAAPAVTPELSASPEPSAVVAELQLGLAPAAPAGFSDDIRL